MIRHLTYANIVATIALCSALGGTAYAAVMITGANIKDRTLVARDFKSESLLKKDLRPAARQALVGPRGATGPQGYQGAKGVTGDTGPAGPRGLPAGLTSTWATNSTGLMTDSSDRSSPNQPELSWDDPAYGTNSGGVARNLRASGQHGATNLDAQYRSMVALAGMTSSHANHTVSSQGLLTMPWAGRMTATASITLLHRNDGEDLATNGETTPGTLLHGRVQCQIAYRPGGGGAFTTMGVPVYASSDVTHELVNVTVTADVNTTAALLAAGSYDIATLCRDPDDTTSAGAQWSLVNANMTVVGSRG